MSISSMSDTRCTLTVLAAHAAVALPAVAALAAVVQRRRLS